MCYLNRNKRKEKKNKKQNTFLITSNIRFNRNLCQLQMIQMSQMNILKCNEQYPYIYLTLTIFLLLRSVSTRYFCNYYSCDRKCIRQFICKLSITKLLNAEKKAGRETEQQRTRIPLLVPNKIH